jgi:hypothetical protein
MNGRATTIRWSILAALGCVLVATGSARAATSCSNDIDCPNSACGGDVCDFYTDPTQTCKPAGTQVKGMDGWCTTNSDCKCASLGAVCTSSASCSFTKPSDAPSGGGGKGGATGTGGAAGSSGPGTGGSGTGGTGTGTGTGTGGAATGGSTGPTNGGSSGGCSVAGSTGSAAWLGLSVVGMLIASARRRRRAR